MNLDDLKAERERLAAYGLHIALALVDAEIERITTRKDTSAPVARQAPARVTVASPPSKAAVRTAGKDKSA